MTRAWHLLVASALLTLPALAQAPAPPGAPETVYSDAQRQKDETLSRRFVESVLQQSLNLEGQYAKWVKPFCIQVGGLAPAAATQAVERRIREIGRKVGAPVDPNEACASNAIVFVTGDPLKALDIMAEKKMLKFVDGTRKDIVVRFPIQAWYLGFFVDNRGQAHIDIPLVDTLYGDKAGMPSEARNQAAQMVASNDSRLQHGIQPQLGNVAVMVDANAIAGATLGSLADYLALMTLSQVPASGQCQPAPSIANLFLKCEESLHVTSLSAADIAMLTGLYETPLEPANLQLTRIIGAMRRNLEQQYGKN